MTLESLIAEYDNETRTTRRQLSVYLRLLDVHVAGAYGPTADERG